MTVISCYKINELLLVTLPIYYFNFLKDPIFAQNYNNLINIMNKYIRFKDNKKRSLVVDNRFQQFLLKYFTFRRSISTVLKFKTMLKLQTYYSITQVKNRCLITNHGRAIINQTSTSKSEFRKLMGLGLITGYKKASW